MKNKFGNKCVSLVLVLVFLLGTQSTVFAQKISTPPPPDPTIKEKVDYLLAQYKDSVQQEMRHGQTKKDEDGNLVLTGESELKMNALWKTTFRQIDDLTARPIEERITFIERIQSIDGTQKAEYSFHTDMPYYGKSLKTEVYETPNYQYVMDVDTGNILQIAIKNWNGHNTQLTYSQDELENQAASHLQSIDSSIDLSRLSLQVYEKTGTIFFRWEDESSQLLDGRYPFVQVGLSTDGNLLTYVNTLQISANDGLSSITSLPLFFNLTGALMPKDTVVWIETYANGGSYWSATGSYYIAAGGYCYYNPTLCPGTFTDKGKYYYKSTVTGTTGVVKGYWTPNFNMVVEAQAFIPCNNATHRSAKYELFTGQAWLNYYVDQLIYCDQFALINDIPLNTIQQILLRNKASVTTYQVAWDEIQVWSDDSW